ncbi:MAG: hypothetical protein JNL90_02685 [Planctomycetes bacterium]|nr:hypothetical protein [Planctomycetota bacterium]
MNRSPRLALPWMALLAACGAPPPTASTAPEPATAAPSATAPSATASVRGVVRWEGEIPERRVVDLSGTPDCLQTRDAPLLDESIVVHDDRAVESVLLFVDGSTAAPIATSAVPARLELRGARFAPHLLAVQAGQRVDFANADPLLYNVHLLPQANDEESFAMPGPGTRSRTFPLPEPGFVKVKDDVHPWMGAWIAVLPHPWFAVTGDDGRYAIAGVPSGRHTLVLRHPRLGEQRTEIELRDGAAVTHDFTLRRGPRAE